MSIAAPAEATASAVSGEQVSGDTRLMLRAAQLYYREALTQDAIGKHLKAKGGGLSPDIQALVQTIARSGGTPLVVSEGSHALGVVHLKDIVKGGMKERFDRLRAMGIRTVMITGDNPLTAAAIAAEAGVDDFLAEATPEEKLTLIRKEQAGGRLVAMTGDGTNDAPALAQADVGVAMNTGTQAAREAGNMVDLDSNPTKLIEIVEIGKQLLMTRGALTTFSIANDVAKYFAIIPAMFILAFPQLAALNVMGLATPQSAILSAVIFNAVFCNALAWLLWLYALQRLAAGVASMTSMLAPVIGVLAAWWQLNEVPNTYEGIGMVLIGLALVVISVISIRKHTEVEPAMGQD